MNLRMLIYLQYRELKVCKKHPVKEALYSNFILFKIIYYTKTTTRNSIWFILFYDAQKLSQSLLSAKNYSRHISLTNMNTKKLMTEVNLANNYIQMTIDRNVRFEKN